MLQVKTFTLPTDEKEANQFLETHKLAEQGINLVNDRMIVFFDDGRTSDLSRLGAIRDLIEAAHAAMFQQEIALATMKDERDHSGYVETNRYTQLTNGINDCEGGIKRQLAKIAFLESKLAEYEKAGE